MHVASKRRIWRKVHVGECPKFHQIVLNELTESNVSDTELGEEFIRQLPKSTKSAYVYAAYDKESCYKAQETRCIKLVTPPQKNAIK